jgi:uncharacterized protein involved in exopolysaccharide biosynthesis
MTQQVSYQPHLQPADDEVDLRELFRAIWQGKWIIIATTFVFAVAAVFYSLSLPNIYQSEVLLAPTAEQKNVNLPGQLGGLAALAGVSLGSGPGIDKTTLALEIMQSRGFLSRFIEKSDMLPLLFAVKSWDPASNEIILDAEIYDADSKQWLRNPAPPLRAKPSSQEAYKAFSEKLEISTDNTSGLVRVSVEHQSPYIAQAWVDSLVEEINIEMRQRDATEAQTSIAYLTKQLSETNIADIRSTLFSLIEEQTKTLMFTSVREEYVFQTVDPAVIPELKSKPRRAIIVAVATIMAAMLSIFAVLIISLFRKRN